MHSDKCGGDTRRDTAMSLQHEVHPQQGIPSRASAHLFKTLRLLVLLPVKRVVVEMLSDLVVEVQNDCLALFPLLVQSVVLPGGETRDMTR